jgi:hypothetical protein
MQSHDVLQGSQRPRLSQSPRRSVASAGDDAIAWAESLGWDAEAGRGFYVLDEWQRWCIRGILSEDAGARLCAYVCLLLVPRQNGKNVVLEVVELYALFVLDLRLILHSAHLAETSAQHMERLWEAIQSDEALASVSRRVVANGKESIYRTDGNHRIRFRTRSKKVGRGGSPQMAVFDEALYLTDEQIQALLPSLSAQSAAKDKPILIYASSAPVAESAVLHRIRTAIIKGDMPDAWFGEWSCELPEGDRIQALRQLVADQSNMLLANPGMPARISPEWVMTTEYPMMSLEAFAIERLGVVFEADGDSGTLPMNLWKVCRDLESNVQNGSVSLSVAPHGSSSAFGFAGTRADGSLHIEVVRHAPGTEWVVAAAKKAQERYGGPILVDPRSPTSAVLADLARAGVEVRELSTADQVEACAAFERDVRNTHLRHLDQPELNAAVIGVDIRPVGESWVFSAKASTVDVQPLLAVTWAAFGAREHVEAQPFFAY